MANDTASKPAAAHPADRVAAALVLVGTIAHNIGARFLKARNEELTEMLAFERKLGEQRRGEETGRAQQLTRAAYNLGRADEHNMRGEPDDILEALCDVGDVGRHLCMVQGGVPVNVPQAVPPRVSSTNVDVRSSGEPDVAGESPQPDPDYGFIPGQK